MAQLTRRDRGQLMLVTALVLAVLFVALALLLNAIVFTGTLATRDGGGAAEPLRYRDAGTAAVADLLAATNAMSADSYTDLRSALAASVATWDAAAARHAAAAGAVSNLTLVGVTNGSRIVQDNATRALTDATGNGNWTLASDVGGARGYRLTLNRSALVNAADSDGNASALRDAGVFRIVVSDGPSTWRLYLYRDGAGHLSLKVGDGSGTVSAACEASGGGDQFVDVRPTAATVGGDPCAPLANVTWSGPVDLAYERGDHAAGTYEVTVAGEAGSLPGTYTADQSPRAEPLLYAATVEMRHVAPERRWAGRLRIVPGDRDG